MKKKIVKLSLLLFLGFGTYAFGQTQGRVEDDNGLPEDDVEVRIKGTNTVTYTDENGNFEIDAKIGDTLIIIIAKYKCTRFQIQMSKNSPF
ncbi:hypothetical protein QP547_01115 [Weeksella virosa]|uniref:hypothetical protein n=1 Tax=Weeksella virosa TaxID=1014 RepID=UPI002556075C|nr:hypothetical protein [Weeksella virosa]MDK7674410.1 hypothetical protein [Weeksella virosa]